MNDKIRELAADAGIAVFGDAVFMFNPDDTLDSTVLDKFAKLIITECCSATEGQPRSEIRNSILNHFGLTVPDLLYKEKENG